MKMTQLAIKSIIKNSDFDFDIILFSDAETNFGLFHSNVKIIKVKNFPKLAASLNLKKFKFYYFRTFMFEYFDFNGYSKILYSDYDIMTEKSILPFFQFIKDDSLYISYAARRKWELDQNGKVNISQYNPFIATWFDPSPYQNSKIFKKSDTGVCSGFFGGTKKALMHNLSIWRNYALDIHKKGRDFNDQHALNQLLIADKIKFKSFPNEWINYPFSPRLSQKQKLKIKNFETSIFRHEEKRKLKNENNFILNHFNPGDQIIKLRYMLEFKKNNKITIEG